MKERTIESVVRCTPQPGTGILHPFPTRDLAHLNPFVFLDTGAPRDLGEDEIYVGPHPHRGVQPVSLLFRGRIAHRDSLGTERRVDSGGMQWLVSGRGALHEEILGGDEEGIFHMAQLWINVPEAMKMQAPEHHAIAADDIPVFSNFGEGSSIRLYAGSLGEFRGPAPMPTKVLVAHVTLSPGGIVVIPSESGWTTAFTVVDGHVSCSHQDTLGPGDTPIFRDDGNTLRVTSTHGGQFLLMCGEPIDEPIAMGGGFVMNTREEVARAFEDYRSGIMGHLVATR
ncbi:MAG: pirin family protein [Kofleriaceae bacterium]|nr:pirin family protein [Kofleriaceae bacterium]